MKETVLITGANSFIAKHLIPLLEKNYNVKLLTRSPKAENEFSWDISTKQIDERALDNVQHIVHLAGSKLNDGTPLTEERKKLVYDSRIGAALLILDKLKERKQTIKTFVSASAIGYYGFTDQTLEIDENGKKGFGFGAELSHDWEVAADQFKIDGIAEHVSKIRVSIVLGNEGGIFPVYYNMVNQNPSVVEQGRGDYVPWNHVEDMAGIFAFAVEHQLDGVFNSVAPMPATQHDIFASIGNALGKTNVEIKKFEGQHLVSKKIEDLDYQFKYKEIATAIKSLV